eukprot:scaffold271772_cov35-Prasinocladus_malaysianus.AAC.1
MRIDLTGTKNALSAQRDGLIGAGGVGFLWEGQNHGYYRMKASTINPTIATINLTLELSISFVEVNSLI